MKSRAKQKPSSAIWPRDAIVNSARIIFLNGPPRLRRQKNWQGHHLRRHAMMPRASASAAPQHAAKCKHAAHDGMWRNTAAGYSSCGYRWRNLSKLRNIVADDVSAWRVFRHHHLGICRRRHAAVDAAGATMRRRHFLRKSNDLSMI